MLGPHKIDASTRHVIIKSNSVFNQIPTLIQMEYWNFIPVIISRFPPAYPLDLSFNVTDFLKRPDQATPLKVPPLLTLYSHTLFLSFITLNIILIAHVFVCKCAFLSLPIKMLAP